MLVFLLVILIITSQFEWKQQLANELEAGPAISQKQQRIAEREEAVKERVSLFLFNLFFLVLNSLFLKNK